MIDIARFVTPAMAMMALSVMVFLSGLGISVPAVLSGEFLAVGHFVAFGAGAVASGGGDGP